MHKRISTPKTMRIAKITVTRNKTVIIKHRKLVELPCLSMESYTFTKKATNRRKKQVNQDLQIASSLVLKELEAL